MQVNKVYFRILDGIKKRILFIKWGIISTKGGIDYPSLNIIFLLSNLVIIILYQANNLLHCCLNQIVA